MVKQYCVLCSKTFLIVASAIKRNRGKYCSQHCRAQAYKAKYSGINSPYWKRRKKNCLRCKGEFFAKFSKKGDYCSRGCYLFKVERPKCLMCSFLVKTLNNKYCSRICMAQGLSQQFKGKDKYKKNIIHNACLICYKALPTNQGKYCSRKCYGKSRVVSVNTNCYHCGKEFKAFPSDLKIGRSKYCSHKCRALGNWANVTWRKKRLENILKGSLKRPTSLEKQVISLIQKYNLPYVYTGNGEIWIGGKNPDFIRTDNKKELIEVGNWFHHQNDWEQNRRKHFAKYGWTSHIFIIPNGKDKDKINEKEILETLNSRIV